MIKIAWILLVTSILLGFISFKGVLTEKTVSKRLASLISTAIWILTAILSYNTIW